MITKSFRSTSTGPPKVFVSYAWGNISPNASEDDRQRQEVVERMCKTLEEEGWQVVRDKTAMQYGDLISDFMKTLGQADLVIVVLSEKYLRSLYCMTELHALYRNSRQEKHEFLNRIIPLILGLYAQTLENSVRQFSMTFLDLFTLFQRQVSHIASRSIGILLPQKV